MQSPTCARSEDTGGVAEGTGIELSAAMAERCQTYLAPLLTALDTHVDQRLVRTAGQVVPAMLRHRTRPTALLLSELGAVLAGPTHAPAGTKRLGNLLHSPNWEATELETWLIEQGQAQVEAAATAVAEGRALCILDGSVLEKPESTRPTACGRSAPAKRAA